MTDSSLSAAFLRVESTVGETNGTESVLGQRSTVGVALRETMDAHFIPQYDQSGTNWRTCEKAEQRVQVLAGVHAQRI